MSLVTPDFGLLFWMTVIFAIVFFLLAKFGFPMITGMVNKRTDYIGKSLADAREAQRQLRDLAGQQEKLIDETRKEQSRILAEAASTRDEIIASAREKAQAETELINYLRDNGINEEAAYNRVFVIPINVGDGPKAALGMKALIKYEAYLLDGTFLGSSDSLDVAPYEVPIGQGKVLKGLDEGIAHMSKGEKAKIVVPYALAFGENGSETIPPFTNLLFVVEVVDLVKDNESIE